MITLEEIPEYARYKKLHGSVRRTPEEESELYALRRQLHEAGFRLGHLGSPMHCSNNSEVYYVWKTTEVFDEARIHTASSPEEAVDAEGYGWVDDYYEGTVMTVYVLSETDLNDLGEPQRIHSYDDPQEGEDEWIRYEEAIVSKAQKFRCDVRIPDPEVYIDPLDDD